VRLALFSDVHGNPLALDAVLQDVRSLGGADAFLVLGDLAAIGHDPIAVMERLAALPNARFARGNTDRYLVTGERPPPSVKQAQADPRLVPQVIEVAQSFAWTQGRLAGTRWLNWLSALPLEQRLTLPDGTRLLGVHAAPGTDDGPGVRPDLRDPGVRAALRECAADLLFVGHTHWPMDRWFEALRVVNLGSVGNPLAPDLRASYVLLQADALGYELVHRRVEYDRRLVVAAIRASRHPAGDFVVAHYRGDHAPPWERSASGT
jgi:predicted phosphodiesterase